MVLEMARQQFGDLFIKWQGDMSDADLMKRANISRNQIYLLRTGKSGTRPETIDRLVQAFNIYRQGDIEEFYEAAGFVPPKVSPTSELTYEETLDDLPPELQRVWGLHGKVAKALAPGRERDAYIKRLEAEAEFHIAQMEERLKQEEEARKKE